MGDGAVTVQALLDAQQLIDETWETLAKRRGESARAHAAFLDYVRMGPGRSLSKLAAHYRQKNGEPAVEKPPTTTLRTLETWSSKFAWQARLADFRQERDRQDQAAAEARRRALQEADFRTGDELRDLAKRILDQTPQFLKTTRRLVKGSHGQPDREVITVGLDGGLMLRALQLASELQNKALGVADKHEFTGKVTLDGELDLNHSVNSEQYERAITTLADALRASLPQPSANRTDTVDTPEQTAVARVSESSG